MALASDLMGLGESSFMAARIASGGTGPVTITAAGTSATTGTQIYGTQFLVCVTAGTGALVLPNPTSANPPLIGDQFVIHNSLGPSVTIYPSTGVTVNVGGTAYSSTNPFTLTTLKTLVVYTAPTTTQWFGLSA